MDKLEQLIKSLQEVKELLSKDAADPKLAPKEVKVKQLKAQVEAGTYKPDPKKIAEKMLSKEEMEKRCWEGYKPTPGKKAYEDGSCEPVSKEELVCSKNGQWDIIEKAQKFHGINAKHIFSMDHIKAASQAGDHNSAKKNCTRCYSI